MTPKLITIRYIKRYKTLATLKFSTSAMRNELSDLYYYLIQFWMDVLHLDQIYDLRSIIFYQLNVESTI